MKDAQSERVIAWRCDVVSLESDDNLIDHVVGRPVPALDDCVGGRLTGSERRRKGRRTPGRRAVRLSISMGPGRTLRQRLSAVPKVIVNLLDNLNDLVLARSTEPW